MAKRASTNADDHRPTRVDTGPGGEPGRVPEAIRPRVEAIFAITDPFSAGHLDAEYGALLRKLVGKLARKRPSPLARGDLRIWAAAAIHALGIVNFLFDPSQRPHLSVDQLSKLTGVPKSTMAGKSKLIRDLLRITRLDVEFCREAMLDANPLAWMVLINGLPVDVRTMPPAVQDELWRLGLIPRRPRGEGPER